MTRDEAVEKFLNAQRSFDREWSESLIDGMAAIGVLKLDEPKSALDKLVDALEHEGINLDLRLKFDEALWRAGLKIVEE